MNLQGGRPPDPRVLAAALTVLDTRHRLLTPSGLVAEFLRSRDFAVDVTDVADARPAGADGVVLLADELSWAGEHAEGLVAAAVAAARPGGIVAASARSALVLRARPEDGVRGYLAAEVHRALGHHGIIVSLLCAPGAGGLVLGDTDAPFDPELDRQPGLLDAAPRVLAVGRTARTAWSRSQAFFTTLPAKLIAAAVVCRDEAGRLLVVHDTFKGHWTIPGGIVDADEDPQSAAEREAREEAGVDVTAGRVLGVFSASWPDRVVLVYDAHPRGVVEHPSTPLHAHEIDAVDWWPVEEALRRLAPHVAEQVRHCLTDPGGSLHQGMA